MDDGGKFKFDDYRGDTDATVPCPKCGEFIAADSTTCAMCGIHFRGRAIDFAPAGSHYKSTGNVFMRRIAIAVLIVVVALIVVGIVTGIMGAIR